MRAEFHEFTLDLPHGWADITRDLPAGSPPSLARQTGVGVIQFSLAQYRSGEAPSVTMKSLRKLLENFSLRRQKPFDEIVDFEGDLMSVMGTAKSNDDFLISRYFSNGRDIALVTYVCSDPTNLEMLEDLKGVQKIMDSVSF